MTVEIGYFADNSKNIHFWDPLTADGSTPAVKIAGINFVFVHKIVGAYYTLFFDSHQYFHHQRFVELVSLTEIFLL